MEHSTLKLLVEVQSSSLVLKKSYTYSTIHVTEMKLLKKVLEIEREREREIGGESDREKREHLKGNSKNRVYLQNVKRSLYICLRYIFYYLM